MKKDKGKIETALDNSPINYFSDLFVAVMVIAWIVVIIVMAIFAIYATIEYADTSIWCELSSLVTVPLSCGGAIWMIKNSVQHAIANSQGKAAHQDFPRVDDYDEIMGQEEPMQVGTSEEEDDHEGA